MQFNLAAICEKADLDHGNILGLKHPLATIDIHRENEFTVVIAAIPDVDAIKPQHCHYEIRHADGDLLFRREFNVDHNRDTAGQGHWHATVHPTDKFQLGESYVFEVFVDQNPVLSTDFLICG